MRTSDRPCSGSCSSRRRRAPKHRVFIRKGSRIRTYCGLSSEVENKLGRALHVTEDFGSVTCGECNRVATQLGDLG